MFAFALWDEGRRRLLLARDRLGIKPLYYHLTRDALVFGSEIKAVLAAPEVCAEMRRTAIPEYLAFGYMTGPETLFQGIHKLMPGHTMVVGENGIADIEEYWDLAEPVKTEDQPESFYADTYRSMLEGAVSSHLMSGVPLGVFLSGGIDSSTVAAMMAQRHEHLATFSVGYAEEGQSELGYARTVAEHLGSEHHEVRVSEREFFSALPKLIWHEDEPIAWPSSVSLYFLARLAREHVTVVLSGEGSDETLGGYGRYPWTLLNARLDRLYRHIAPASMRRGVRKLVSESRFLNGDLRRKFQHTFLGRDASDWLFAYFEDYYSAFSEAEQKVLLVDDLVPEPGDAYRNPLSYWEKSSGPPLSRLLYTNIKSYLVELLMKQDNMSMAASVESRVPFLDHELVEFALRIPPKFKIRGQRGKHVLKKAVGDLLPESILHRRKMGFPTPIRQWLQGPQLDVVQEVITGPRSAERCFFEPQALGRLFDEHRTDHRDHTDRIWRLLNLEHWCRIFLDGEAPAPIERS